MIGYTKAPPEFIFQEKAIIYDNAIVLVMEMDKAKIDQAPHKDTLIEIHKTYRDLGIAANKLASFLRSYGFSAQSSHPLGGIALYPRLGKLANLGWEGRHGLLITPKFGPRVRIAAVFTSIANLPFAEENTHGWISDYCINCGLCIQHCPVVAAVGVQRFSGPRSIGVELSRSPPEFWSTADIVYLCTGCGTCREVCPKNVNIPEVVNMIRTRIFDHRPVGLGAT